MKYLRYCTLLLILLISGCSSVSYKPNSLNDFSKYKSVYIVKNPQSDRGIDQYILDELTAYGFQCEIGETSSRQNEKDLIIRYKDIWLWDVIWFLGTLDIEVIDARTLVTLADAQYMNYTYFHGYPSAKKKTAELLHKIFNQVSVPR